MWYHLGHLDCMGERKDEWKRVDSHGELQSAAKTLEEWRTCENRQYELIFCLERQRQAMLVACEQN